MFIHTHLHTWFSNYGMIDSINDPSNIIKKIHKLGQLGFAVTDHDGCSGLVEIYAKVKKYNQKNNTNIKLLFGSELYYVYDVSINEAKRYHCLFLAKNEQGRINLNKLVSEAHRHYYKKSRIDLDIIKQYSEGLICTSACMGGWLASPDAEELIPQFKDIFGDDLYFELHTYQHEEQYVFNHKVIELADKYDVKMIACCDAHYTNPEDYELHKAIRGIQPNEEDKYYQSNDFYIQSEDEVKERLKYLPKEIVNKAIDNTVEIFNKCNVTISALDNKENNYPKFVEGDPKPLFLEELRKGYKRLGIQNYPPEKKKLWDDRLLHEIDVLEKVNYMDYLLITKDILDHCKEKLIPIGVGRGSANGCECCHLLGITTLDSITNKLYFERFANEHRTSFCDIDNDVSQLRRGEVIDYIKKRYGYVYQCRTFSYMKAKGALKKACTALCIDFETSNKYAKMLDAFHSNDDEEYTDVDLEYAMLDSIRDSVKNDQLIDLAKSFVGILVGFNKHASAVVILNKDISEFCSLESQVDSSTKERVLVAGCDFHILEEMGILKEDILGLRTLDVIDECIKLSNKDIDISKVPWEDDKTCQLLQNGDNLGVFQMASSGMVRTLKDIKPTKFQDMIAVVALYRPACILGGTLQEYIDRRNGKPFEYLDPRLEEPLGETYGIMVYQEQIMRVVQVIAGYSLAEADLVRRAIGRKDHELMKQITSEFVERSVNNNTKKEVAEKILDMIISAGSYSFNKSHSQSYGYLSWITAYLKAHYPKEFYIATINSEHGDQEKIIPYIQDSIKKGFKILPPDLRKSDVKWTLDDGSLRVGLNYIKGIGSIEKPEEYTMDCIYRTYNKRQLEALVLSGALDFLGDRDYLYGAIQVYLDNIKNEKHYKERIEYFSHLISASDKRLEFNRKKLQEWQSKLDNLDWSIEPIKVNQVQNEMHYLGISLNDPLRDYDTSLVNGHNVIAGVVTKYNERKDRNGNLMASIELHNGKRLVMFSRNYLKPLEIHKGYYFAIRGDIINKTKELEPLAS